LLILAVFAVIAVGVVAAILISRSGGDDDSSAAAGVEGCKEVEAPAPKTVNSFVYLSDEGFYDGLGFHRIAPGFVIQGGDPLGTGIGGPGYSVTEKPPANLSYTKGTVAMAKSSADPPGRSGSQFYVVTAADAGLPPEYALVGKVDEGYDVVERIDKLGTPAEKPKQPVLIEKITIEKG
jgi:cyclophilin family peptidyl-prolyl cis-trans isomerase